MELFFLTVFLSVTSASIYIIRNVLGLIQFLAHFCVGDRDSWCYFGGRFVYYGLRVVSNGLFLLLISFDVF